MCNWLWHVHDYGATVHNINKASIIVLLLHSVVWKFVCSLSLFLYSLTRILVFKIDVINQKLPHLRVAISIVKKMSDYSVLFLLTTLFLELSFLYMHVHCANIYIAYFWLQISIISSVLQMKFAYQETPMTQELSDWNVDSLMPPNHRQYDRGLRTTNQSTLNWLTVLSISVSTSCSFQSSQWAFWTHQRSQQLAMGWFS